MHLKKSAILYLLIPVIFFTGCETKTETADLILANGKLLLMDKDFSTVDALAISGDRIVRVGSNSEILKLRGPQTQFVDLGGRTASPGMIESHIHFAQLGRRIRQLFLNDTRSREEAIELVRQKVSTLEEGEWVTGAGWHTATWDGSDYPDGKLLNQVTPDNPVYLTGMSWHAAWVNKIVMDMAGIDKNTPDPVGGIIVRDPETGEPTGVFLETAQKLVETALPKESDEQLESIIQGANDAAAAFGITTIHDAQANDKEIAAYRNLIENERLKIRIYTMYHVDEFGDNFDSLMDKPIEVGSYNNRLTLRTLKIFSDGALGARGAALHKPYSDDPTSAGLLRDNPTTINNVINKAFNAGYQVAYHAIGDRANHLVLDAYQKALESKDASNIRPRIEHAQILSLDDLPRFGSLGVIASMQPLHFSLDQQFAEARLGKERMGGAYAWRSLINSDARVIFNSDAPFSPVQHSDPLIGIYAADTRRSLDGSLFNEEKDQRLTRREAIESFTIHPAYAAFEENIKGSLKIGMLADIAVWSNDISQIPAEKLLSTEAVMTIIGGEIVYDKENLIHISSD